MRLFSCTLLTAVILAVCIPPVEAAPAQYVEVKKPFANIYKFLDPKSTIIKQAKKGDHFELVYEGTSWYQVKFREEVGWLEKRAGSVVNNPGYLFSSVSAIGFIIFLVLLAGTFGGVSFYIYKQKTAEV
jgi:hypothetical protein